MALLRDILSSHPQVALFGGLAPAMVAVLLVASRDVALEPGQRTTLIISTVLLAALCVWIVHWESEG